MSHPQRLILSVWIAALLAAAGTALAIGTGANESITNVASATYIDSAGDPQSTTSNPVTTIVQQVYDLTITPNGADESNPGQTVNGLPGSQVSFSYTLTNTGNGNDTVVLNAPNETTGSEGAIPGVGDDIDLSGVAIYLDAGCDGTPDGSPISSIALAADQAVCIVVVGTLPAGAADGDIANVNLEGQSVAGGTVGAPAGPTDTDNWARAVANTGPNMTAAKSASPTGAIASGATLSYTINGSNNGGSAAYGVSVAATLGATPTGYTGATHGIIVLDTLPGNTTYAAGSLAGAAGAGSVTLIYQDAGGWTTTEPAAANVLGVGMIIEDDGVTPPTAFFTQGATYTLSFDVTVDGAANAGDTISNQATVTFSEDGVGSTVTTSNPTNNTVAASYVPAIGPAGQPIADGLGDGNPATAETSYTDPVTGDLWNVSLSGGFTARNDTQTITDTVYTGDIVAFRHTLQNSGNDTDTFDLSAVSASGYAVTLFQADGVTPLAGPVTLGRGLSRDIVVKVAIPVGAESDGFTGDTVTVTATSRGDGSNDISTDGIPEPLSGFGVDVAQQGASGDGNEANDTLGSTTANPGDVISFPVEVTNTGQQNDSFDLTATLPAGWTVVFVEDANCDGTADGAAVATTPSINPNQTVCYVAQVTVPAGAPPSAANLVSVTATSTTDPTVSNTVSGTVDVATVADIVFVNDQVGTTVPNGTITYTHTVTNNGNDTATVTIPAPTGVAFTYQFSLDGTTWVTSLDGGNAFAVAPGATQPVFVRVLVPPTANDGDSEQVTLTATGTYPDSSTDVDSVIITTNVQAGELDLVKSARTCADAGCSSVLDATGATAEPLDYIEYTITADNIGTANLTNVRVLDPLPTFTNFISVTATTTVAGGTVLYSTDGSSWSATAPGALATGATLYVGVDTNGDTDITAADALAPSDNITIVMVVQVQ